MGDERDSRYVACPYYIGNLTEAQRKAQQIRCEGVGSGNYISLVFVNASVRKAYKKKYCFEILGCRKCLVHQMLNRKYGVDDEM